MRYIYHILKIATALYLAKFVAVYVAQGKFFYISILFAGSALFYFSTWKQKFVLFFLIMFFPPQFPEYFPLPVRSFSDLLAPILCILSAAELLKRDLSYFSSKASLFFVAIAIFSLWTIIHYILNPVFGQSMGADFESAGLRNYIIIFTGITTFFCSYWFFMHNEFNSGRWLFVSLILCLIIGNLHVIGLFTYVRFLDYFSLGTHSVNWGEYQYQSIPLRQMTALGTSLVFSLLHTHRVGVYNIIAFINILVFMLFGGGRGSLLGLLLAVSAYFSFLNRKHLLPAMAVLLIFTAGYTIFLSNFSMSDMAEMKYGRAFKFEGGLKQQSEERYYTTLYMLEVFKKSPILGKGIGYQKISPDEAFFDSYPEATQYIEYIEGQLMLGGHGAYPSILSLFGIGGIFWLLVMLFGSLYYLYRFVRKSEKFHNDTAIAVFTFLQLIAIGVGFVSGGGYGSMKLWFLAGIAAGLISKERSNDQFKVSGA